MLYGFLGLAVGLVIGFFASRYVFKKNLKKNSPINEKMILAMFIEIRRKPNETQIKRKMKNINDQYK